jgi:hypothetical protein
MSKLEQITEAEAEAARTYFNELVEQYPYTYSGILPSSRYALFDYPQQAKAFSERYPDWEVAYTRREIHLLIGEVENGRTLITLTGGGTQSLPRPRRSYRVSQASVERLKALAFLMEQPYE